MDGWMEKDGVLIDMLCEGRLVWPLVVVVVVVGERYGNDVYYLPRSISEPARKTVLALCAQK